MSRERKLSLNKRAAILESAIDIFSEKGFEGASMDKIAEQAKVSKITIYKHFQNKESLFLAIVSEYLVENKKSKPVTYSPEQAIETQLAVFIEAELYRVTDSKQRGLSRLLTSVYLYHAELVKDTMQQHPFFRDFMVWLGDAKKDGKLEIPSEFLAAQMFYGLIHGCLTWNALLTDGASLVQTDQIMDEIIAVFLSRYGTNG
ncbi:MAG: TetR/AcrR family transcriptional regulator, regulator of autoinduction and epiphytic fitness [Clostridiales bacterium]|nr:TetR/AcrR family transcriptional regulator, regulator of autoinduction and epiphytic fitness [Clostridiales bacterium]